MSRSAYKPTCGRLSIQEIDIGFEATLFVIAPSSIGDDHEIKLMATVGDDRGDVFLEINIYNNQEEFENVRPDSARKLGCGYIEIADIGEMMQKSYPKLPAALQAYLH